MVERIDGEKNIYINGNHLDSELIYTNQGETIEGIHSQGEDIAHGLKIAAKTVENPTGGILYIHSNIPEDSF